MTELKEVLSETAAPDWITFSGTGEPTLHSDLGLLLKETKALNIAPTCVITNTSLIHDPQVRSELMHADRVLPTLTTVNSATFNKIHHPTADIQLDMILTGLQQFANEYKGAIELEIFVCPGLNDSEEEILTLRDYILSLDNLQSVYLNTSVRTPFVSEVITADQALLNHVREMLSLPIPVSTAFEHSHVPLSRLSRNRKTTSYDILKLLLRHPCTIEQMEKVLGTGSEEIQILLNELIKDNQVKQAKNGDWQIVEYD